MYIITLVSRSRNKMSIKSLMIPCVEIQYTQEYIANVFWRQYIAKVNSITLLPYVQDSKIYSIAYISIAEWCDSEAAYNFIKRLKNPNIESRIVHHEDNWWPIQLNTHNNGNIAVGCYTLAFDSTYFMRDESLHSTSPLEEEYIFDEEGWQEFIIRPSSVLYREVRDEINHFENEWRIQEALNKSSNVTLRAQQFGRRKLDDAEYERLAEEYFSQPVEKSWPLEEDDDLMKLISRCEVVRNCDEMFA